MNRNVVITGIGILSPIGIGRDSYWEALFQGKTGFREISLFDTSSLNVHIAGEISDFDPVSFLGKKGLRTLDRSTTLISSAAMLAIDDAGLQITNDNANAIGVSVGTTFGSLHSISQFDREGLIEGPKICESVPLSQHRDKLTREPGLHTLQNQGVQYHHLNRFLCGSRRCLICRRFHTARKGQGSPCRRR